ncbi:MAG: Ig-like domain-containing protein [Bacteroidales bacterium]|nr:Ig-like domain-containing protein [Bacteroidales bacterium]
MRKILSVLSVLALLVCACQKAPELTISGLTTMEVSADGGSGSITFTTNRDWSATCSAPWIHVGPNSGSASDGPISVMVRCDANTTYDPRSGSVTITAEGLTQTITVNQPANLGLIVPTKSYDLSSNANTIEVEVQANVPYMVSISDSWVKQTGTKGLTKNVLMFSVAENTSYDARSTTITIKSQTSGVADEVVTVRQAQKDALIVKDTSFSLPYGGGGVEVTVESNVSFEVTSSVDWIHHVSTKALSSSTVNLSVDENKTYASRTGKVVIKQKGGGLSHTVTVSQTGRIAVTSITLDQTSLTLQEGESATLTATVKPDNATDKTVTWSSSNTSVATVDENGKVTAVKEGSAKITAKAGERSVTCTVTVAKQSGESGDVPVPEAVDLGLSVKWASFNLGASKPEEYGDYYAWGETEPKSKYDWETYKWANGAKDKLTKYCMVTSQWAGSGSPDNKFLLDPEDDVAHVKLGGRWRMPTSAEWQELRIKCTWTWTTSNGISGREVTGPNGNSIFLPAAGDWYGTSRYNAGSYGNYWSSSLYTSSSGYAWGVYFYSSDVYGSSSYRYFGQSVRPVSE